MLSNKEIMKNIEKLIHFSVYHQIIRKKQLLQIVNDMNTFLKIEFERVQREKGLIDNIRGHGTFLAFDCNSERDAHHLQQWFLNTGIHLLRCGPATFGLKPSLKFNGYNAAILRDSLLNYSPHYSSTH